MQNGQVSPRCDANIVRRDKPAPADRESEANVGKRRDGLPPHLTVRLTARTRVRLVESDGLHRVRHVVIVSLRPWNRRPMPGAINPSITAMAPERQNTGR